MQCHRKPSVSGYERNKLRKLVILDLQLPANN